MLDTSKIIIENDGVRYADHNKYWERFDLHEKLIKKNVELLLSYGVLLSISDLLSVVDIDDEEEHIHYRVIDRQFVPYDDIINVIYYFDDL
jgi:hypothetical protein